MSSEDYLTPEFVEQQRQRLETLRDRILADSEQAETEERFLSQLHATDARDSGDQGAIEAQRDNADAFGAEGRLRLASVRRALEKVAEGSYGISDESGEPIARARLEAVPEACFTVEEEAWYEQYTNL